MLFLDLFFHFIIVFLIVFNLQEVLLENVENLAPSHSVDSFDGNDVPINGVLPNVGHDVSIVWKDPLDGALIQDLLDGHSFFGVMSHVTIVDTVLTQQVSISIGSIVPVLSSRMKIYDHEFFDHMFDLELLKFRVDLERIYGQQPLDLVNVNKTFKNVFSNL